MTALPAGRDRVTTRALDAGATLLLIALTLAMFAAFFPLPADDAYIVARYVRELYAGHGLVFNPGERINAVTSPLLTFVFALIHPLVSDPVGVYRIAAAALVAWTLVALARRAYAAPSAQLLFLALALASPFVCFWAIGGLETPLLLASCSWLTWIALSRDPMRDPGTAAKLVILATVAVLARYDAALFVAPIAVVGIRHHRRSAPVIAVAMVCAGIVAGWIAFTYFYYGDILPTSFYVKLSGEEPWGGAVRGAVYAASFGVLTLLVPVGLLRSFAGARVEGRRSAVRLLVAGAAAELVYGVFAGDKHMLYAYRLFVPYLPSLLLLSLSGRGRESAVSASPLLALGAIACLGYQTVMGCVLYYLSENPNLSLLWRRQEIGNEDYEFSTIGARYTRPFLAAVRGSAREIDAHWQTTSTSKTRPLRIAVLTGGLLPYHLPEAYTLETLVSYRHRCHIDLPRFADYAQLVQNADAPSASVPLSGAGEGWQLISKHELTADGWQNKPFRLRVDVWYHSDPLPVPLPARVDQPCAETVR
jgi:hypothetical protein